MKNRIEKIKISKELKDLILKYNAVLLEPEELDKAIIGIGVNNNVIYGYQELIGIFISGGMSYEEAQEWMQYNVIRALPYLPSPRPQIV